MKSVISFAWTLLFLSVSIAASSFPEPEDTVTAAYSSDLKMGEQKNLSLIGSLKTGDKNVREISLYYSSNGQFELNRAREMFIPLVENFLKEINENGSLKGQLSPYPFTEEGLDVVIFFRNDSGNYSKPPKIAQISMQNGEITYYKFQKGAFDILMKESFIEARKKLSL